MAHKISLRLIVGALTIIFSSAALAQVPLADPRVRLEEGMKYAAGLASLGFTEQFKSVITANGQTTENSIKGEMLFRGQNDFACMFTSDSQQMRLVSNGSVHFLYPVGGKTYRRIEEPISRSQFMTAVIGGAVRAGGAWVADYLHNGKALLDAAQQVERKGEQTIGGTACEGTLLAYQGFDLTAWLTVSDPPVLRRVNVDLEKSLRNDTHGGADMSAQVQIDILDWKPNLETKDSQFTFIPPDGVELAKDEPQTDPMDGTAAKPFELPLLDGGAVKLADLKGKTVVLDFWASWCGPCRMAMPMIEKVMKEFAGKNAVLYAVNIQEDTETVKNFLRSMKLDFKVALDKDGSVGKAYGAPPIPSIFVIAPDGMIGKVFRGIGPDFENELRAAVNAAMAKEPAPAK